MMPEASVFMAKAVKCLVEARAMLGIDLAEAAGRTAYLAGFHAAQALIFEREHRVVKTHRGVHAEFLRLTKDDPKVETDLRVFPSRSYRMKAIADYGLDANVSVSIEDATDAIATAERLVAYVERDLGASLP